MTFDFDALSENFKKFYDAFSPEAYERSMEHSAEYYSVLEFSNRYRWYKNQYRIKISDRLKHAVTFGFYTLFLNPYWHIT